MKQFISFTISIAVLTGILFACSSLKPNEYTIKVYCSEGFFHGNIGNIGDDGKYTAKSVNGSKDETYYVKGQSVSCTFQKESKSGTLTVEILKNGKSVKKEQTTADYGVVTIAE